jgi:hypothetical protein
MWEGGMYFGIAQRSPRAGSIGSSSIVFRAKCPVGWTVRLQLRLSVVRKDGNKGGVMLGMLVFLAQQEELGTNGRIIMTRASSHSPVNINRQSSARHPPPTRWDAPRRRF